MSRSSEPFGMAPQSMMGDARLSSPARLVYCAISLHCQGRESARVSFARLTGFTGFGETALRGAIKLLQSTGWLRVITDWEGHAPLYTPSRDNPGAPLVDLGEVPVGEPLPLANPYPPVAVGEPPRLANQGERPRPPGGEGTGARFGARVDLERDKEEYVDQEGREGDGRSEDPTRSFFGGPSSENLRFPETLPRQQPTYSPKDSYSHDEIARLQIPQEILETPGFRWLWLDIRANAKPGDRWGIHRDNSKSNGWAKFPDYD